MMVTLVGPHLLVIFLLLCHTCLTEGASCNADQQQKCLHAVIQKRLSWLSAGGECFSKQYVEFTHLCSVYNYLPRIDYCCCALTTSSEDKETRRKNDRNAVGEGNRSDDFDVELLMGGDDDDDDDDDDDAPEAALCCRYHQTWNHFRCLESEDAVRKSSEPTTQPFFERFIIWDLSVVSLILGLVSIFVSCVVCCFKFWKCRDGSKADGTTFHVALGQESSFTSKTKIDLLENLDPPPYNKTEAFHPHSSLQHRQQQQQEPPSDPKATTPENNLTIDNRHLQHLYHIFTTTTRPPSEVTADRREVVMRNLNHKKSVEKRCCSEDLDDFLPEEYNFSSLSCSSESLRSDVTSDTDCDKQLNRYSFYRRHILSSNTRLSPSFQSSSSRSRRPRSSFPRFYRHHHHHHHHRNHQPHHSVETTRFLSNGQIFMSEDEKLKFLERVLRCQVLERNQTGKISLTSHGNESKEGRKNEQ